MYGYIYIVTNLINGTQYVGKKQGTPESTVKYLGSGIDVEIAHIQFGKHNFSKEILEVCSDIDSLNDAERKWISFYNAVESDKFYNRSPGGDGGDLGPIAREKLRQKKKEWWKNLTEEERLKVKMNMSGSNHPLYGKNRPSEANEKTKKTMKQVWSNMSAEEKQKRSDMAKGELNSHFGKNHSNEAKAKISEASKKWHAGLTEERKAELRKKKSDSMKGVGAGRTLSEETKRKLSIAKKAFYERKRSEKLALDAV